VIAQEELPKVCAAVIASTKAGGAQGDGGAFRDAVQAVLQANSNTIPAAEAAGLVELMKIGSETAKGEFGARRSKRLMLRAAGVGVNAFSGSRSGLPGVKQVLGLFRLPLRLANWIADKVSPLPPPPPDSD
jgi:hypothetical protein